MLPGPDATVSCPHCGAKARYPTLISGNTFGATYWTDGKRVAPMLPGLPQFVRCGSCGSCYWLEDEIEDDDGSADAVDEGRRLPYVKEASEAEMLEALRSGRVKGAESERKLRVLAWWMSNDPLRTEHPLPDVRDAGSMEARRGNLQALVALLDDFDDNDMIMRAEIHRELGDFDAARRQLDEIRDVRFADAVKQLRALCDARDTRVRQLQRS